jgi:hypothetical protein
MKISRPVGHTGEKLNIFIQNATVSTGAGLANVSSEDVSYTIYRSDMTALSTGTCSTSSGSLGLYFASTLVQLSSTDALGWYQFHVPNFAFAGGTSAILHMYGAASMAPVPVEIDLSTHARVTVPVGVSTLSTPVTASSGVVSVSSATIPFGVSSVANLVGVSTITIPVGVSSIATPVTASSVTRLTGVSTLTIPVGVSSIATPVTASSVSATVGVSTLTIPVSVSSVTALVGVSTVTDKAGYSVSSATAGVNEAIADALLNRNVSGGANTGRLFKEAVYVLRNKVDAGAGIVYETDDTTSSWSFSVSTQASDPIVSITPN